MHPEAFAGFGWAIEQTGLDPTQPLRVLDVGGADWNGTVHSYFTHPDTKITTLDLENADVLADATTWEPDQLFDVVIATEVFEHVEAWWEVVRTMRTALDALGPGVFLTTCASTNRHPHGATGAPSPVRGEWYQNIDPDTLQDVLAPWFSRSQVRYLYPPGDAYAWAIAGHPAPVTVVIPTIPSRKEMLQRAVSSVQRQTYHAQTIRIGMDDNREGPAIVRNRIVEDVETEWIAFLDDDDELLPQHIDTLIRAADETGADIIWPWFTVVGGNDPFPAHRGRQWDPDDPHQIPITALVRTSAFRAVGGFRVIEEGPTDRLGNRAGEDYDLWLRLSAFGCRFHHVDQITWRWHHWSDGKGGGNTSGLPSRVR